MVVVLELPQLRAPAYISQREPCHSRRWPHRMRIKLTLKGTELVYRRYPQASLIWQLAELKCHQVQRSRAPHRHFSLLVPATSGSPHGTSVPWSFSRYLLPLLAGASVGLGGVAAQLLDL
jgi:hypothetical protein